MVMHMDLFGKALLDFSRGDQDTFFFEDSSGNKWKHPLKKYFRDPKKFTKLQKRILIEARGRILDVGCGTGNYLPSLNQRGTALGIDISPNAITVARETYGLKNVKVADIFNYMSKRKFDTIILMENNLGLAGSPKMSKQLLNILTSLLKKNGQILTDVTKVRDFPYLQTELIPVWKGKKGRKFKWMYFNVSFLKKLCEESNLDLEILDQDRYHYLAKMSKKSLKK